MLNDSHSPAETALSLLVTVAAVGASAAVSAVAVAVAAVIVSVVASAVTLGTPDIVAEKQLDEKAVN